jgi:hypothetical protein
LRAGLSTPVDTPGAPADLTETVAITGGRETSSDVNAPTILTVDAAETSAPAARPSNIDATVYEPAKPVTPPPKAPMPAATVAESAAMASSMTVPQVVKPAPASPPAIPVEVPAPKSKAGIFIAVGVVLVLILAAGVGGFLFWKSSRSTTGTNSSNANNSGVVVNTPAEISRYWLELEPPDPNAQTPRVAALVPLASGQSFKFHFTFNEDGYLYIFGPGDNNQPTAFLTTRPIPQSGVTSNRVTSGNEFSFPSGSGNNLTLDKSPGTDNFTVIFAKTPLPEPSFLNQQVTGEPLSSAQQADLKTFVGKYQERSITEPDESNARAPFVRVKAKPDPNGNPIVFNIRIQHN